jgi:glycosyltransferase involved in cell wall biosynthesis
MMKKSKIVVWTHSLVGGGAERVVATFLQLVDLDKFDITLLIEDKVQAKLPHTIKVVRTKWNPFSFFSLLRLLRKINPDVIVSHQFPVNIRLLMLSIFLPARLKTIITEHNNLDQYISEFYRNKKWLKYAQFRLLFPLASRIFVVSEGMKEDLYKKLTSLSGKVSVIYNPIDIDTITRKAKEAVDIDQNKFNIIAVGRLVAQKGYFDMLQVIRKLVDNGVSNAKLSIFGKGILENEIIESVNSLGLINHVEIKGFVGNPWAYIAASDVFLSTSHHEGFPLNLIEAMACNTPVVCTDCDFGPREIIKDSENGFLVPVGSIDQCAVKLQVLMQDTQVRNKIIEGAARTACEYKAELVIRGIENEILKVIKDANEYEENKNNSLDSEYARRGG